MNYVTTNLRFPKNEYDEIKRLAFIEKKSVAAILREAARDYKFKKIALRKNWKALYNSIVRSSVKIDGSVVDLVKQGRKFE